MEEQKNITTEQPTEEKKAAKPKVIKETMDEMLKRQKEERKALKKQMAEKVAKENQKYTKKMVAAVRAFYKGKTDKEIYEMYQAKLQEPKAE